MNDWTVKDGRTNSSDEFERIADEIERLIRNDSYMLISGRADNTARLILAQLAHVHHMRPVTPTIEEGHNEHR